MLLDLIYQGGPIFMVPIVCLLLVLIVLFVKEVLGKKNREKTIALMASISVFTLVWGVLGQVIGLIGAFDAIEAADGVSMAVMAGGLKISSLPTVFGLVTFLIARLGMVYLIWRD